MKENIIKTKSYQFALDVVKVCQALTERKEYLLSKQLLRSGTSIGANIEEAMHAQTTSDFIHKLSIAQKESSETNYWIRLLTDSAIVDAELGDDLLMKCDEIQRIIAAILKTTKSRKVQHANS